MINNNKSLTKEVNSTELDLLFLLKNVDSKNILNLMKVYLTFIILLRI